MSCELCGFESNNLNSHIVRTHKISVEDYTIKFPNSETMRLTAEQVEKIASTKRAKDSANKRNIERKKLNAAETISSGLEPIKCKLCDKVSANSLISHIVNKHCSMDEYRNKFPDAIVQQASPSQKRKNSKYMKDKLSDPDELAAFLAWRSYPSEVKHWIKKGYDPREAHAKVSEFQKLQSAKGNNEENRRLKSLNNSGELNPMSIHSIAERNNVSLGEARKLTPCYGRTGEKHPFFGKKHTEEALAKIGESINRCGRSRIEHELSDEIIDNFGGEKNVGVSGWCCDYVSRERKLIVEFFGDFWHHNPKRYDREFVNPITKRSSDVVWERDARKLKELRDQGYEVIVIWESDWHNDKSACIQKVKDAVDNAKEFAK